MNPSINIQTYPKRVPHSDEVEEFDARLLRALIPGRHGNERVSGQHEEEVFCPVALPDDQTTLVQPKMKNNIRT